MKEKNADHGWAPDVGTGGSDRATEANQKAFDTPSDEQGPGRTVSDEEREGVPPTDTTAETPLGVGESTTKRGEEYGAEGEEGRETQGTQGESDRPYGTTEPDSTGVDQQGPIDEESPNLPPS
jgi:hypothetical protein